MNKTNTIPIFSVLAVLGIFISTLFAQVYWRNSLTEAPFSRRFQHQMAVFNDKMWISGGANENPSGINQDLWSSTNGIDWEKVADTATFPMRVGCTFLSFKDCFWVFGGNKGC